MRRGKVEMKKWMGLLVLVICFTLTCDVSAADLMALKNADVQSQELDETDLILKQAAYLEDEQYNSIASYLSIRNPSEVLLGSIQKNKKFLISVELWKTATFDPGNIPGHAISEVDYYETIIMGVLNCSLRSNGVLDSLNNYSAKTELTLLKQMVKICKEMDKIDYNQSDAKLLQDLRKWSQNIDIDKVTSDKKAELLKIVINKKYGIKDTKYLGEISSLSLASDLLSISSTAYDLAKRTVAINELLQVSDSMVGVLEQMYQNCPLDNLALKTALGEVYTASKSSFGNAVIETLNGMRTIGNYAYKAISGEVWSACISSTLGSLGIGAMIGQVLGKTLANIMFSTDKTIEQYYKVNACSELLVLSRLGYAKIREQYLSARTAENSGLYVAALQFYENLYLNSCDIAKDYADIIYTKGLWNKITKSNLNEDYLQFISSCNNIKENTEQGFTSLLNMYLLHLEDDTYDVITVYLDQTDAERNVRVTGIEAVEEVTWGVIGQSIHMLDCHVLPLNATDQRIIYKSSNPAVVDITGTNSGYCQLNSVGTAVITATSEDGNFSTDITVHVTEDTDGESVVIKKGQCGPNAYYDLYNNDTAIIYGTGAVISNDSYTIPQASYILISEGITEIEEYAFSSCGRLKKIVIPESVRQIGRSAFSGCSSLETITLPSGLTEIKDYTFSGCKKLKGIELPEGITEIEQDAFGNCNSLTALYFTGNEPSISSDAFYNLHVTAYYPANNETWKKCILSDFNGTVTWMPYEVPPKVNLEIKDNLLIATVYGNVLSQGIVYGNMSVPTLDENGRTRIEFTKSSETNEYQLDVSNCSGKYFRAYISFVDEDLKEIVVYSKNIIYK